MGNPVALITGGKYFLPEGRPAMIRPFLIIAAACIAVPASAQFPDYDTASRCAQFARGNRTIENQCRHDEADARQEIEKGRISSEILADRVKTRREGFQRPLRRDRIRHGTPFRSRSFSAAPVAGGG